MADWTLSQWIIIPLIFITAAVVAMGMIALILGMLYRLVKGPSQMAYRPEVLKVAAR